MLTIFIVALTQGILATMEVAYISKRQLGRATLFSAFNAGAYCAGIVLMIESPNRLLLIPAYVVGNALATFIGMKLSREDSNG